MKLPETSSCAKLALLAVVASAVTLSLAARGASAEGDMADVGARELPLMVLPPNLLPGTDLKMALGSGFSREEERLTGEDNSYTLLYIPEDRPETLLGTVVLVVADPDDADALFNLLVEQFYLDVEAAGGEVAESLLDGFADRAVALWGAAIDGPRASRVIFRTGRLLGISLRTNSSYGSTVDNLIAFELLDRMKAVLMGDITELPARLPPDPNCDGRIDSKDAAIILQLSASLLAEAECDLLTDANQDSDTNAVDAQLILQYTAGLLDRLPAQEP